MVRDVRERRHRGHARASTIASSMQRYLSITANVEGEDLGRAARQVQQALHDAGEPPRGVRSKRAARSRR